MAKKEKLFKAGQTVFIHKHRNEEYRTETEKDLIPATVEKCGRVWVTATVGNFPIKFSVEGGYNQVVYGHSDMKLYESTKAYLDYIKHKNILSEVHGLLKSKLSCLTFEQLKKIKDVCCGD